ncbi:aminofutalosine synthase MqnE [bacterium]|nr:aminofutalosine synthase MqnE [bacterium]
MSLAPIRRKIESGQRLTREDALALYRSEDFFALAEMADAVNVRKNGNKVYFNINRHINPTNVCVYAKSCQFCSFAASLKDDHGYTMSDEQILEAAAGMEAEGAREIHIVGGIHPRLKYDWYRGIISMLHEAHPEVHLKAWTAVEIDHFTRLTGWTTEEVLADMRSAGVGSLPGGGAEIFQEDIREKLCGHKSWTDRWFEVHKAAHELGLRSNATMLYGHIEALEDRVDHMDRLRTLQDETGGFQAFIPLAYHPENNPLPVDTFTTGMDDLRTLAVARLFLDNFQHVKTYWIMVTEKLSQLGLRFGANDIDGTVVRERITHDAGGTTPEHIRQEELVRLIKKAGRVPVERNTVYEEIALWQ